MRPNLIAAALSFALAGPALAQMSSALAIAESEVHGPYLSDGAGRPVYAFSADRMGEAEPPSAIACEGECLETWAPVTATGEAIPGPGIDPALVGSISQDEAQIVTYGGWPLYYFAGDGGDAIPQGQGVQSYGGTWTLLTSGGDPIAY